ncbi:LysR family transcriptional regulator [Brevundimonas sp. Leaf363]|uniref:transcriptional regulator GcvA n=1 Tax=Brevundimonas sp. Leaf363 TaxID=1736353 RepID=UPI0006F7EA39|nr:transcriptional regulator GcvA [Brevundimonas sp. Leaf363]KQS55351.1 LysR family transcriptional regulator [Brevundimonas sp. Leaf363]
MARPLLPLNALRAFESAARHLNFSRAADELFVTPGAVSQQIRLLEETVGGPLFKREARGLQLTPLGRAAAPLLREGFERLMDASSLLREPPRRRQVSVSVTPSFAAKWLMPRMDDFHAAHPEIEVWISADLEPVDLYDMAADLAVRYGPGGYEGYIADKLMGETVLPVCAPSLMKGEQPILTPGDLQHHALLHDVSDDDDPSRPDWSMWLKARGVKHPDARRGSRFNQSSLLIEAAIAGRGVALAKRTLAQQDLASGRLIAPFPDGSEAVGYAYYVILPRDRAPTPGANVFAQWLKKKAFEQDDALGEL